MNMASMSSSWRGGFRFTKKLYQVLTTLYYVATSAKATLSSGLLFDASALFLYRRIKISKKMRFQDYFVILLAVFPFCIDHDVASVADNVGVCATFRNR